MREAVTVRPFDGQHFVVTGDETHFSETARFCAGQRMHENIDAVLPAEGRQAKIGDDEPLCRKLFVILAFRRLRRRRHHVNA